MDAFKLMADNRKVRLNTELSNFSTKINNLKVILDLINAKTVNLYNILIENVESENFRREQNEINPKLEDTKDILFVVESELLKLLDGNDDKTKLLNKQSYINDFLSKPKDNVKLNDLICNNMSSYSSISETTLPSTNDSQKLVKLSQNVNEISINISQNNSLNELDSEKNNLLQISCNENLKNIENKIVTEINTGFNENIEKRIVPEINTGCNENMGNIEKRMVAKINSGCNENILNIDKEIADNAANSTVSTAYYSDAKLMEKSCSDESASFITSQTEKISSSDNYLSNSLSQFSELPRFMIKAKEIKGKIDLVYSPWCFWFTPCEVNEYLDNIHYKINRYLKLSKPKNKIWNTKPVIGTLVSAKYQGVWYRARIISISTFVKDNKKCHKYRVYYIDYGNCEELDLIDLRPLPDALQKYPIAAFCCCLLNAVPKENETYWNETSILQFSNLVLRGERDITSPEVIIEPIYVRACPLLFVRLKITKEGDLKDVSETLISSDLASEGTIEQILSWYYATFESQMIFYNLNSDTKAWDSILTNEKLLNLHCPQFDMKNESNVSCCLYNNNNNLKVLNRRFEISDDCNNMVISYIDSPNLFWIQSISYSCDFFMYNNLLKKLTELISTNETQFRVNIEEIKLDVCYAAKDENDFFYRCEIYKHYKSDKNDMFEVEDIDEGGIHNIDLASLYHIPEYFVTSLPRMAVCCELFYKNKITNWTNEAKIYFERFMINECRPRWLQYYFSTLYTNGTTIEPTLSNPMSLLVLIEDEKSLNIELKKINDLNKIKYDVNEDFEDDDPKQMDYESLTNSYAVNYEDSNVATLNHKMSDNMNVCHFYRVGKKCWKNEYCKFLHVKPGERIPELQAVYTSDSSKWMKMPEQGQLFLIQVSLIISPSHFFAILPFGSAHFSTFKDCQKGENFSQEINSFKKDLNDAYSKKEFGVRDLTYPAIGEFLVSKSKKNAAWCRSIIKETYDRSVQVFHVDYGNIENIDMTNLREMDKKFIHFQYLSIECFLKIKQATSNDWTNEALNCFESLTKSQLLIAEVIDDFFIQIFTTDDNLNICNYMVEENLAQHEEESLFSKELSNDNTEYIMIPK